MKLKGGSAVKSKPWIAVTTWYIKLGLPQPTNSFPSTPGTILYPGRGSSRASWHATMASYAVPCITRVFTEDIMEVRSQIVYHCDLPLISCVWPIWWACYIATVSVRPNHINHGPALMPWLSTSACQPTILWKGEYGKATDSLHFHILYSPPI